MNESVHERRIFDAHYSEGTEFERSSKHYTRRMVPPGGSLKILDIGCGTGVNARALATAGHTVVGIDVSPVAIDRFRKAGFEGQVADVADGLPGPDSAYDLVFASEVIEHLADTHGFLCEVRRVLRPGGMLVMSTPNSAFWAYRVLAAFGRTATEVQHPGHIRFFSIRSLRRHLADAGLVVTNMAARHMYMVLGGRIARSLCPALEAVGFQREFRVAVQSDFWHLSRFSPRASGFWADTLIVTAERREADGIPPVTAAGGR